MRYDDLFADIPEIRPLERVPWQVTHCWHLYVIRLDVDAVTLDRNEFMSALGELQIGSGLHYPALHSQRYYREKYGHEPESLPISQRAGDTVISLSASTHCAASSAASHPPTRKSRCKRSTRSI